MGKTKTNKENGKVKVNGEIKIVKSPREFTFVEDVYTRYSITNNTDLDEKRCKDIRKLSDIRNKNKIDPTDFWFKSKGRHIQSKQGHSPVYE